MAIQAETNFYFKLPVNIFRNTRHLWIRLTCRCIAYVCIFYASQNMRFKLGKNTCMYAYASELLDWMIHKNIYTCLRICQHGFAIHHLTPLDLENTEDPEICVLFQKKWVPIKTTKIYTFNKLKVLFASYKTDTMIMNSVIITQNENM